MDPIKGLPLLCLHNLIKFLHEPLIRRSRLDDDFPPHPLLSPDLLELLVFGEGFLPWGSYPPEAG